MPANARVLRSAALSIPVATTHVSALIAEGGSPARSTKGVSVSWRGGGVKNRIRPLDFLSGKTDMGGIEPVAGNFFFFGSMLSKKLQLVVGDGGNLSCS